MYQHANLIQSIHYLKITWKYLIHKNVKMKFYEEQSQKFNAIYIDFTKSAKIIA